MDFAAAFKALAHEYSLLPEECEQRALRVCKEFLQERGYAEVNSGMYQEMRFFFASESVRGKEDTLVVFPQEIKASVKFTRELIDDLPHIYSHSKIVIVTICGATKVFEQPNVEHLTYKQLMLNPCKHCLVPLHEYVPPCEAAVISNSFNTTHSKFPQMSTSDPICVFKGFEKGDLVRIYRNSFGGFQESNIAYRVVV